LFLAAKQILVTQRQATINNLINSCNEFARLNNRYENIDTINRYFDMAGEAANFTQIPLIGTGSKL
jgi:hypothetical protein